MNYADELAVNKLGYAEVRKTYKANENKITNRYYGENGEPVRLSNGQYGSIEYGYSIHYIGLDGSYVFNLQRELDNYPYVVAIIGLLICVLMHFLSGRTQIMLLIVYLGFIIFDTIIIREKTIRENGNSILFWSYSQFFTNYNPGSRY